VVAAQLQPVPAAAAPYAVNSVRSATLASNCTGRRESNSRQASHVVSRMNSRGFEVERCVVAARHHRVHGLTLAGGASVTYLPRYL
jgi:hypothetical protein